MNEEFDETADAVRREHAESRIADAQAELECRARAEAGYERQANTIEADLIKEKLVESVEERRGLTAPGVHTKPIPQGGPLSIIRQGRR